MKLKVNESQSQDLLDHVRELQVMIMASLADLIENIFIPC